MFTTCPPLSDDFSACGCHCIERGCFIGKNGRKFIWERLQREVNQIHSRSFAFRKFAEFLSFSPEQPSQPSAGFEYFGWEHFVAKRLQGLLHKFKDLKLSWFLFLLAIAMTMLLKYKELCQQHVKTERILKQFQLCPLSDWTTVKSNTEQRRSVFYHLRIL